MSQTIQETSPLLVELTGLFFISILVTGLIVYTDITFFDSYVLDLISRCYATNQEDVCMDKREDFGLPSNAQLELGNPYWNVLMLQYIIIPIGFAGFRLITIAVRKRIFTPLRIFVIILWGIVPLILFSFGVIDVFYYVGRGLEVPASLDWLNSVGIFHYTKAFGSDPMLVERSDLLFTFALGVIFISLLFFTAVKMYEKSKLKGFV